MTKQEILAHIELVRELSREGRSLHDLAPTATIHNPDWFGPEGILGENRASLHTELLDAQFSDANVSRKAILLAGPPGAGKTTIARQLLGKKYDSYQTIDPDVFKPMLLRKALDDGSYEAFIKPAEIKELETKGHRFYPMELSSLVRQESSLLAQRQRKRATESP